jgi:hypothetical protein
VHALVYHGGEVGRQEIERDLLAHIKPPCNEMLT